MGPRIRQQVTTASVIVGLISSAWLLSAFNGDVAGIFESRDRRFGLLLVTFAAVISALSSKVIGFVLGFVALVVMVSVSYPAGQVDVAVLRVASLFLALFDLGLGLLIWLDRKDY